MNADENGVERFYPEPDVPTIARPPSLAWRTRPTLLRPGRWLVSGLVLGMLCASSAAWAGGPGIYRHVDKRGVVHFTNITPDSSYTKIRTKPRGLREHVGAAAQISTYDRLIRRAAQEAGIPPALVKAVIHAESAFDPRARSPKGAMGLMQLMPGTAAELGVADAYIAEQNVHGGTRYLRHLHDKYGSWTHTLAAYNAGPNAVDRYRGVPPYAETRQYVRRVLSYYRRYHGDFPR